MRFQLTPEEYKDYITTLKPGEFEAFFEPDGRAGMRRKADGTVVLQRIPKESEDGYCFFLESLIPEEETSPSKPKQKIVAHSWEELQKILNAAMGKI